MVSLHDNYIFEGFEVAGYDTTSSAVRRAVYIEGENVVVRDNIIHNTYNGIQSSDTTTGNMLLEFNELYQNGYLTTGAGHQIYVATDQFGHQGSVLRAQFNYIHDNTGGSGIASRAERSEVYYNYIQGTTTHALSIGGPDRSAYGTTTRAALPSSIREDGDIVGNVIVNTQPSAVFVNIGGDLNANVGRPLPYREQYVYP